MTKEQMIDETIEIFRELGFIERGQVKKEIIENLKQLGLVCESSIEARANQEKNSIEAVRKP